MTNKPLRSSTSETLVLWMTYLLYLLFAPALVGFGINYFASKSHDQPSKQPRLSSENSELIFSHHQWLMRTFVFVSAFVMIGIGTSYLGVGYLIAALAIAWWFYRVIKGMVAFAHHRHMPA